MPRSLVLLTTLLPLLTPPSLAQEVTTLTSPVGTDDLFGQASALDGDHLLVGAPWGRSWALDGRAHLFRFSGDAAPEHVATLDAPGAGRPDRFGWSLALDGGLAVVGAPAEGRRRGAVYVFESPSGDPEDLALAQRLVPPTPRVGWFGFSVALDAPGDRLAVGAPRTRFPWGGTVYVYDREAPGTPWTLEQVIDEGFTAANWAPNFGWAVELEDDLLAVSSYYAAGFSGEGGFVHLYDRGAGSGSWELGQRLRSETHFQGRDFSRRLFLEGGRLFLDDDGIVLFTSPTGRARDFAPEVRLSDEPTRDFAATRDSVVSLMLDDSGRWLRGRREGPHGWEETFALPVPQGGDGVLHVGVGAERWFLGRLPFLTSRGRLELGPFPALRADASAPPPSSGRVEERRPGAF